MTPLAKKLLSIIGDESRTRLPSFRELWRVGTGDTADSIGSLIRGGYIVTNETGDTFAVTLLGMRALKLLSAQGVK